MTTDRASSSAHPLRRSRRGHGSRAYPTLTLPAEDPRFPIAVIDEGTPEQSHHVFENIVDAVCDDITVSNHEAEELVRSQLARQPGVTQLDTYTFRTRFGVVGFDSEADNFEVHSRDSREAVLIVVGLLTELADAKLARVRGAQP